MRMRRKKHREERLVNCAELIIEDITLYKNDLSKIFDNGNPIRIEIGCGKGKFICETAAKYPDVNFIAVEKCLDVLVIALEKVQAAGLGNVKFVAGDVNMFSQIDSLSKCDVIYINFCDPWKKNGYAKRRLTHANFLCIYKRLLKNGGELHFKTDNQKLFEFSLNSFSDFGLRLKNITFDLHASNFEDNVMTEYETNFTNLGQPIYRCEAIFEQNCNLTEE